jgi:hypothetical protein
MVIEVFLKKRLPTIKKLLFLYPLLFAITPVLMLFSTNLSQIHGRQIFRPILIGCAGVGALLLILGLILKDLQLAASITALMAILFFSYGHVYISASIFIARIFIAREIRLNPDQLMLVSHLASFALWLLVGILGPSLIRRAKRWRSQITSYFALLGLVAILSPALKISRYYLDLSTPSDNPAAKQTNQVELPADRTPPDIYYIILDGYGRQDVLRRVYQYDNSPFLNRLQDLGFYYAAESRSNYPRTHLSLASSLNMDYLDQFMEFPSTDPMCMSLVTQKLTSGEVLQYLRRQGYQIYALATNYEPTEIRAADFYIVSRWRGLNDFEALMMRNSFFALLYDGALLLNLPLEYPGHQAHRTQVHFVLETLERMPEEPGPKFVFAHVISPHPPFVFGPTGEPITQQLPFRYDDGYEYPGTTEEYIEGYRNQLTFINSRIQDLVQHLIEDSENPPIIILQGDHGPRSSMIEDQVISDIFRESVAILNAYYFPDGEYDELYPSISPINTFRVVLNHFFNEDYDPLPDLAYHVTGACGDTFEPIPEENELEAHFENGEN